MEGVGTPPGQNSASFLPHLLISIGGITATTVAIVAHHFIVKYIMKRLQRSTVSASQTLQFAKGIDEKVLQTIPILAYSTKDGKLFLVVQNECVICLREQQAGEIVRLLPSCRHEFHVPCIGSWFLGHISCPVCRSPIVVEPKSTSGKTASPVIDDDVSNEGRLHIRASGSRVEYLSIPIEEEQQLLATTLKRSLPMGECYSCFLVGVQNDGGDDQSCSSSSTRILWESKSSTAASIKQLDRMSSSAWNSSLLKFFLTENLDQTYRFLINNM